MTEDQKNCKHEADHSTVTVESDGGQWYIDVSCGKCGLSGCIGPVPSDEDINWD